MQLDQLEHFRVLAQFEHMTNAADHLRITQPALSRSIARLEAELGVELFDRRGRGIALNPVGREYLRHVEQAFRHIDEGRRFVGDMATGGRHRVRFTDNGYSAIGLPALRGFLSTHSDASVEYRVEPRRQEHASAIDETDVVLRVDRPPPDAVARWVECGPIALELWDGSGGRRPEDGNRAPLEEFSDAAFVGALRDCESRQLFEQLCHDAGFSPRFAFETADGNLASAVTHALRGVQFRFVGIGATLQRDAAAASAAHSLRRILVPLPTPHVLGAVIARHRRDDAPAAAFARGVRRLLQEPPRP